MLCDSSSASFSTLDVHSGLFPVGDIGLAQAGSEILNINNIREGMLLRGSFYTTENINFDGDKIVSNNLGRVIIDSVISGTGDLVKYGDGVLMLQKANIFTGAIYVVEGTLRVFGTTAIQYFPSTAPIYLSGYSILDVSEVVQTTGDIKVFDGINSDIGTAINIGSKVFYIHGSGTYNIGSTIISTGGSFVKTGTGTMNLFTDNQSTYLTYNNNSTSYDPGVMNILSTNACGKAGNSLFCGNGAMTRVKSDTPIADYALKLISFPTESSATYFEIDRATSGSTSFYTSSDLALERGTFVANKGSNVTSTATMNLSSVTMSSGSGSGTRSILDGNADYNIVNITSSQASSNLVLELSGTSQNNNIRGIISNQGVSNTLGTVKIIKSGTEKWTLWGNNTYTGGFNLDAGTLEIKHANAIGTLNAPTPDKFVLGNNTTLLYTGNILTSAGKNITIGSNVTIDSSGAGSGSVSYTRTNDNVTDSLVNTTLTLMGSANTNNSFGGAFRNDLITGAVLSLVKNGAGRWLLNRCYPNGYTGTTTVNEGTLGVVTDGLSSSAVYVNTGATFRGTSNPTANVTIAGNLFVNGTGILQPAIISTSTMTVAGSATFESSSSRLQCFSSAGTIASNLIVSGTCTLNNVTVNFSGAGTPGTSVTIITAGTLVGTVTAGTRPTGTAGMTFSYPSNTVVASFT